MPAREDAFEQKLDTLIRLLATLVTADKPQREQIRLLSRAGLQPAQIADLIGTTANNVRVRLVSLRKEGLKSKGEEK